MSTLGGAAPSEQLVPQRAGGGDRGGRLLMHVTWRAYDSLHRIEEVTHLQSTVIAVMERVAADRRTRAHGMFTDVRGGFAVVEIAQPKDLLEMFAGLHDVASLEAHPVSETGEAIRFLRGMLVTEDLLG